MFNILLYINKIQYLTRNLFHLYVDKCVINTYGTCSIFYFSILFWIHLLTPFHALVPSYFLTRLFGSSYISMIETCYYPFITNAHCMVICGCMYIVRIIVLFNLCSCLLLSNIVQSKKPIFYISLGVCKPPLSSCRNLW